MSFAEMSADEIRAYRETVLLRLLLRVSQIENAELVARLHGRGHTGVQTSHIRMLANLDTEGTRLIVLAGRTGTTRQAVSQLVGELERRGFIERATDPADARAVLVRHTAGGRRLLNDALEDMADIEDGYAQAIGEQRMHAVKAALQMIADTADPSSVLGR